MVYEFKFPDVGEGVNEGIIVSWKVNEGDFVAEDTILGEVETAKAIVEMPSPKTGTILKLHVPVGSKIKVGDTLVTFGASGEKLPTTEIKTEMKNQNQTSSTKQEQVIPLPQKENIPQMQPPSQRAPEALLALPGTKKLAAELHIDLEKVNGTGFKGRITDDDVKKAAQQTATKITQQQAAPQQASSSTTAPSVTFDQYGRAMKIPFEGMRKIIAERMKQSAFTIPQVTAMDDIDITPLAEIREREKAVAENKGIKLTYLPFIIKACIIALKDHPYVNASLDEKAGVILLKEYYNMGFAYDSQQGLVVPVIHHADQESILDIAKKIEILVEHVKDKDIKPIDLVGATFTITNYGSIGTLYGTPLVNPPNVAILGLGRILDKPVVVENEIVIRKILPISLSYDHRVVDGAEAARFLQDLKKHLENPELLLLDMF